jgi:hypothetical protein
MKEGLAIIFVLTLILSALIGFFGVKIAEATGISLFENDWFIVFLAVGISTLIEELLVRKRPEE